MAAIGVVAGVAAPLAISFGAFQLPPALVAAAGVPGAVALVIAGLALASGAALGFYLLKRGRTEAALASAVSGAIVVVFLAGTVGGLVWSRMQSAEPFCDRIAAVVPKGTLLAVDNAKYEQVMFYTLRPTAYFETDAMCLDLLRTGRCRYAVIRRPQYERLRATPPVDGLAILAEGAINGGEFVLVGPQAR
jgi:hypothetical protein